MQTRVKILSWNVAEVKKSSLHKSLSSKNVPFTRAVRVSCKPGVFSLV